MTTKVAILWSHASGYLSACSQALVKNDCEIFLAAYEPDQSAPFTKDVFSWLPTANLLWWDSRKVDETELEKALFAYNPQIILCGGWAIAEYLDVCRKFDGRAVRVLCLDTPWLGTPRQWIGRLWARIKLVPHFDRVYVPGERQFLAATMLGFRPRDVIFGLLSPDTKSFTRPCGVEYGNNKTFLYVGRLTREKGIRELAVAYATYREKSASPWSLSVAGEGPLSSMLEEMQGVNMLGFVHPADLPLLMFDAGCMVVPSLYEAWGVQISEAVTAGLPVIATLACGSSVHLVKNNINGLLVEAGDINGLTQAMIAITEKADLDTFSRNSYVLSRQFTPDLFALNLLKVCRPLFEDMPLKSNTI